MHSHYILTAKSLPGFLPFGPQLPLSLSSLVTLPIAVLGRGRRDGARLCQTKLFVDVVDEEAKKGKLRKGRTDDGEMLA